MSLLVLNRSARRIMAGTLLLTTLAAPGLARASHAASAPGGLRTITLRASHPVFPTRIPAGLVALHVVNDGTTPFFAGVARPNPGISLATALATSAHQGFMQLMRLVTFLGGTGAPAGHTATMILDLRVPGQYGVHITRSDQDPGVDRLFSVVPTGAPAATPPRATVTVTLAGTHFVGLPARLPAGTITVKVRDSSPGARDMLLYRVDAGKTVKDMIVAMNEDARTGKDPAWAHEAGLMGVLSPHQVAWLTVTLAPGRYVALCPLPDPARGGQALALEGMIVAFTVS